MEIPSAGFVARPKETCSLREQSSPLRSEHESTPETGILSVQAIRAGVILAALTCNNPRKGIYAFAGGGVARPKEACGSAAKHCVHE